MSGIVYLRDKRLGSTYAYQDVKFVEPGTGRLRTKREYLGRVDPSTGEIVPKKGGRRTAQDSSENASAVELAAILRDRDEEVVKLREQVVTLKRRNAELESAFARLSVIFSEVKPSPREVS